VKIFPERWLSLGENVGGVCMAVVCMTRRDPMTRVVPCAVVSCRLLHLSIEVVMPCPRRGQASAYAPGGHGEDRAESCMVRHD
jgi:hypothetical protein